MTVITRSTSRPICWVKTFPPLGQDRKWAGDMSCIWTNEGWRYLAVILSLFLASDWLGPSRTCCANPAGQWSAIELMAVALRQPPRGCSHHTDRGSQYCSVAAKSVSPNTASQYPCAPKAIVMIIPRLRRSSKPSRPS